MKYQVTISNGEKYYFTEAEAKNIASGENKGLVFVPSLKGFINLSFVVSIIPEDKIDKSKMTSGVLHDGTKVIKRFGEWRGVNNPDAVLDAKYYPEAIKDEVMTEEEYEERTKCFPKI